MSIWKVKECEIIFTPLDYGILRSGAPIIFCDERLIYCKMLRHICSLLKLKESAFIFSAAVPQARKASLARFLEKRKERYGECILLSVICNGEKNALMFELFLKGDECSTIQAEQECR